MHWLLNEWGLFKYNLYSLRKINIFKNRRINIITALIYYLATVYIYLLTWIVAFSVNSIPFQMVFFGVDMFTNILFLIIFGYRCQDYGVNRYIGIILVLIISSLITIWDNGNFFINPEHYILLYFIRNRFRNIFG